MQALALIAFVLVSSLLQPQESGGTQYLYPLPGTDQHSRQTVLIFRFAVAPDQIQNRTTFFEIAGEASGPVSGRLVENTDGRTFVFKPSAEFMPGEIVSVRLKVVGLDGLIIADTAYSFTISTTDALGLDRRPSTGLGMVQQSTHPEYTPYTGDPRVLNGVSVPANFPAIEIAVNDDPSEDLLFVNARTGGFWSIILDNGGNPIWYRQYPHEQMNFTVQPDGRLTVNARDGTVYAWDSTYTVDRVYHPPPGYDFIDSHEFISLPNGHYWLIVTEVITVDMSQHVEGGHPDATVEFQHVVEMDANDNPIFIWRSQDYFDVLDSIVDPLSPHIDPVHMNSIAFDNDGHILITSRHVNEVTKINRNTGDIIWRLGGKNDYFSWVNDGDRISHQHATLALPNGNYTLFDNGNERHPEYSRALELALDTVAWTATKVWEYREGDRFCWSESNAQRLPNGNTLINWKEDIDPAVVEVRPDGSKAFEVRLGDASWSYRAFRSRWNGTASVPYLVAEPHYDRITLVFNKFGDADISEYRIYGGTEPGSTELLATTPDPFVHLTDLLNEVTYHFRVTAVSGGGEESGFSNEVTVFVHFASTGENLVRNGGFEQGMEGWSFTVDGADATGDIVEGEFRFDIFDGGPGLGTLRLVSPDIRLNEGSSYIFEFDAYAVSERAFRAEVVPVNDPWNSYSRIGNLWLTTSSRHFAQTFRMEEPYEPNGAVLFEAGGSNEDVFVDNVSLKELSTTKIVLDDLFPDDFQLFANYPNPFSARTSISYELSRPGHVLVQVFDVNGALLHTLVERHRHAGRHVVDFDGTSLAQGFYFVKLSATDPRGGTTESAARAMSIVR